ncbi:ribosome biogenesis GTP-binding protein YihA/YsxC [Natronospora cellulosivora (SeqCode)]
MKVKSPQFVTSAFDYKGYPEHNFLEIAFSGRSNVGKSSMINKLLNRKKLARTSAQPGRTQSINFFNIDEKFFLVDLPGYGFAKVPKKVKDEWGKLINGYLHNRPNLAGVVQIVDARHKPSKDDQMMVEWLLAAGFPTLIVATKVDKISKSQRAKQEKIIRHTLGLDYDNPFCFFSAKTGEGDGRVSSFILGLLE